MPFATILSIALGGAIGSVLRYLGSYWALPISHHFPWGTLFINVIGSFVIGFFGTLTLAHGRLVVSDNLRLFVLVGLCGGFTTFSSFSLQTFELLRAGQPGRALLNIGLSVFLCLASVAAGYAAAVTLNGQTIQAD